ncbi:unnamed protein product [marine sediment metagenome]|uniref:Uncharacterized protein n=1 Tax=marine sediment metagenome TaxID=412755 RepID=X1BGY0_9ZZZZ
MSLYDLEKLRDKLGFDLLNSTYECPTCDRNGEIVKHRANSKIGRSHRNYVLLLLKDTKNQIIRLKKEMYLVDDMNLVKPFPHIFCEGCMLNGCYQWNDLIILCCSEFGGMIFKIFEVPTLNCCMFP